MALLDSPVQSFGDGAAGNRPQTTKVSFLSSVASDANFEFGENCGAYGQKNDGDLTLTYRRKSYSCCEQ